MKTPILNAFINIASALSLLCVAISGLILFFFLPSGEGFRGGRNLAFRTNFWALSKHSWVNIHNIAGIILIILILIHLIMHWQWIKNMPKLFKERR